MQPQRTVLKYFAIFKNVAHSLEPGELLVCTTFLNIAKNDEIKTKSQFTVTATEPHRNRKFRQFNNDQYCKRKQKRVCTCQYFHSRQGVK